MPDITVQAVREHKGKRGRFDVYADGECVATLGAETVAKNGVREDAMFSRGEWDLLVEEDSARYAFGLALNHISYARRTEEEAKRHLRGKGLGEKAIAQAVAKLKSYGYIDDADYAKRYVSSLVQERGVGKQAVSYKLRQRGVPREIIEDALHAIPDDKEEENARKAYAALSARYEGEQPEKRRAKIVRGMAAKGFGYETVQSLLNGEEA